MTTPHADRLQLLFRVRYDGGRFHGVELQPRLPTVGGALAARIADALGQPPRALVFTSRTDGGVHARENLATAWVRGDFPDLADRLAALAAPRPDGLQAVLALPVPITTYARGLARSKWYRYTVEAGHSAAALEAIEARVSWRARQPEREGRAPPLPDDCPEARRWHIAPALDPAAMQQAADHLVGTHDFSAFRSRRCTNPDPVRTLTHITVTLAEDDGEYACYHIDIRGESFLRNMARIVAGALVEVGSGWRSPDAVLAAIQHPAPRKFGITAPSRGLTLMSLELEDAALAARLAAATTDVEGY